MVVEVEGKEQPWRLVTRSEHLASAVPDALGTASKKAWRTPFISPWVYVFGEAVRTTGKDNLSGKIFVEADHESQRQVGGGHRLNSAKCSSEHLK